MAPEGLLVNEIKNVIFNFELNFKKVSQYIITNNTNY